MTSFAKAIVAAILVLMVLCLLGVWRVKSILKELGPEGDTRGKSFEEALMGPKQEPAAADQVFDELLALPEAKQTGRLLWGADDTKSEHPTPAMDQALASILQGSTAVQRVKSLIQPAMETAGSDPILTQQHSYRELRRLVQCLTAQVLSLLLANKPADALDLLGRTQEMSRILGRGDSGRSNLGAKMIEVGCLGTVDTFVGLALQRHLVPQQDLDRLDALYADALKRELGMDVALSSELDLVEKAVKLTDRRLGLQGILMRLYWGNGVEQIAKLRKLAEDPDSDPPYQEMSKMHLMIRVGIPSWHTARNSLRKSLSVRTGVRAAVELEKLRYRDGKYPPSAPADVLDPITSKPYVLRAAGNRWLLYGPGVDGNDDGGNPVKDAVIWR